MSPPDSTEPRPGLYVAKPRPDIYTVLLIAALVALVVACVCLYLELSAYEWTTTAPRAQIVPTAAPAVMQQIVRC